MATLTITNDGLNLIRDGLTAARNPFIGYIAIGTGNSTPTAGQHQLDAEVFRKKISTYTNGASAGEIIFALYLAAGDAVGVNIAEVGVFGGPTAGAGANTGVMLGRGLYSHSNKLNTESIQIQADLTI